MLNPKHLIAVICAVAVVAEVRGQTTVSSEPFGYVKINIAAGTGTSKRTSLISIPLLDETSANGKTSGRITGVTSNTITVQGAGWTAGQLSTAATPHLIEITSGNAQGRMLLISTATSNTAETVTIATTEIDNGGSLANLGIAVGSNDGDTFRLRPVDTIGSFFGTPETTLIRGGTSAKTADTIIIMNGSTAPTFFYNTGVTPKRWTQVGMSTNDASNTAISPQAGVQYARLADTPLQFIVTGRVPSGARRALISPSTTILASYWPANQTLGSLGLNSISNWGVNSSSTLADKVTLVTAGTADNYYHDGTNWRQIRVGRPLANDVVVPVGSSVMIRRASGSGSGFATYSNTAPYNLQ
jgi:hypothetical protein